MGFQVSLNGLKFASLYTSALCQGQPTNGTQQSLVHQEQCQAVVWCPAKRGWQLACEDSNAWHKCGTDTGRNIAIITDSGNGKIAEMAQRHYLADLDLQVPLSRGFRHFIWAVSQIWQAEILGRYPFSHGNTDRMFHAGMQCMHQGLWAWQQPSSFCCS